MDRRLIWILALIALPTTLAAQRPKMPSQAELVARRDAKMARPVFETAPWTFDYDEAVRRAGQQSKPILVYFTRSHGPCPKSDAIEANALSKPAFVKFAEDFVLLAHVTSWVKTDKHPHLLRDKKLAVLPTLAFLDPNGDLIAQDRRQTLASIVETGGHVRALLAAKKTGASKERFFAELALGLLDADAIEKRLAELDLTAAERESIDARVVDAILADALRKQRKVGRAASAARVAALHREGRRPSDRNLLSFWEWVLEHAANTKDGKLADEAYPEVIKRIDNPNPKLVEETRQHWKKVYDRAK